MLRLCRQKSQSKPGRCWAASHSKIMETWLRLFCVTSGVGGGFCGIAIILQYLDTHKGMTNLNLSLVLVFLVLYAFVMCCGLLLVIYPQRTLPFIIALGPQIAWVSPSKFAFKFEAGIQL